MPALPIVNLPFRPDAAGGNPLCGGWLEPIRGVDDALRALGVVLLSTGASVVLCVVDGCGVPNDANLAWRQMLVKTAHTKPAGSAVAMSDEIGPGRAKPVNRTAMSRAEG